MEWVGLGWEVLAYGWNGRVEDWDGVGFEAMRIGMDTVVMERIRLRVDWDGLGL